ncbi:MAG: DUF2442 domain-containing protein [Tannerellaceae bacterium]|jgi:hypothetical protein|nr:DUF2442 domain-containing protein [Tannerellaceae bacterium]
MEKIDQIWFAENRIFMKADTGRVFNRPIEAFPLLKNASEEERHDFRIGKFGDDIRWDSLDEDIHISSFLERNEPQKNVIGEVFAQYPQINVSAFAAQIGINKSLLAKYIYGIKTPSVARKKDIENGLHEFAEKLLRVELA